jgi:hypothetical protein
MLLQTLAYGRVPVNHRLAFINRGPAFINHGLAFINRRPAFGR